MTRLIAAFALAACLAGCASSPFTQSPVANRQPNMGVANPNIPASQYECVTDEGYGRWYPCSAIP